MLREEKRLQDFADAGEEKVAAMLGTLKRVDAPADFDFRVRARIAQGRPAEAKTSWFPAVARGAIPALVLALVGGLSLYYAFYHTGEVHVIDVADSTPVAIAPVVVPTSNEVAPAPVATNEVAVVKPPVKADETVGMVPKKESNTGVKVREESGGGSGEFAARETNTIRLSTGNVENTGNSRPTVTKGSFSVLDIFASMGIRARFEGGWRVSSASGRVASAGLKQGDVIEAINGKPVGANTVFDSDFSGHTLRVKRDGAMIQISL